MSRKVEIKVKLTNEKAITNAVNSLGVHFFDAVTHKTTDTLSRGKYKLYSGEAEGIGIMLEDWKYPIVVSDGGIAYDNYEGLWGSTDKLDRFRQQYSVEATLLAAKGSCSFSHAYVNTLSDGRVEILLEEYL